MAYQPKSYRKFLATGVATAMVATTVAPAVSADQHTDFTDIEDVRSWAGDAIDYLVEKGAIQGMGTPGIFNPQGELTRGQAASLLANTLGLDVDEDATSGFDDLAGHWSDAYVAAIQAELPGVIDGYTDGTFRPETDITRQEMAKITVEAFDLEVNADADVDFEDNNSWGAEYVEVLASLGILGGYTDGTIRPEADITRAEAAVFVHRTEVPSVRLGQDEVAELAVESVSAINTTSFEVDFNMELEEDFDLAEFLEVEVLVDGVDEPVVPEVTGLEVAEDGMSVVVEHEDDDLYGLSGTLVVNGVELDFDYTTPIVESVNQLINTGVEVEFKALVDDFEDFELEVVNPSGQTVAVNPVNLTEGDTEVFFEFETALQGDADDIESGVWTIGGFEYDYAEFLAVKAVRDANNQLELLDALQSNYFTNVNEDNITAYQTQIDNLTTDLVTAADVQELVIDAGNASVSADAAVEGIIDAADAGNQVQLLNRLKSADFERIIDGNVADRVEQDGYLTRIAALSFPANDAEDVQTEVDAANLDIATQFVANTRSTLTRANYNNAVTQVSNLHDDVATKSSLEDDLEELNLLISLNEAQTNATFGSRLNSLVALVDNAGTLNAKSVYSDNYSAYRSDIQGAGTADKNTPAGIQSRVDVVNAAQVTDVLGDLEGVTASTSTSNVNSMLNKLARITPNNTTDATTLLADADEWFNADEIKESQEQLEAYRAALVGSTLTDIESLRIIIEGENDATASIQALETAANDNTAILNALKSSEFGFDNVVDANVEFYSAELNDAIAETGNALEVDYASATAINERIVVKGNQVAAFDEASTATEMRAAIAPFGVTSTDYVDLTNAQRLDLAQLILNDIERPTADTNGVYATFADIESTIDDAAGEVLTFLTADSTDNVNFVTSISQVQSLLNTEAPTREYVLFDDYRELTAQERIDIATEVFEQRPEVTKNEAGTEYRSGGYQTIADIIAIWN